MSDRKRLIKSVLLGTVCGMLTSVIFMCILAVVMLTSGLLSQELTNYIMIAICAIGAFVGGIIATKLNKGAGLIVGLITGGVIFILITIAALIKSDSSVSTLTAIRFVALLLGGALGGIIGIRERKKINF